MATVIAFLAAAILALIAMQGNVRRRARPEAIAVRIDARTGKTTNWPR